MKRISVFWLACLLMVSLPACGRDHPSADLTQIPKPDLPAAADYLSGDYPVLPKDGPVIELSLGHAMQETALRHQTMLALKEALEVYSDGKMTLTIYPNGQLGSDGEMIVACILGDVDLVFQSGSVHSDFVPEAALFDIPFLFTDADPKQVQAILTESPFREGYDQACEAGGLVCLMLQTDIKGMYLTANRPITDLEDLKGLKIRVAPSPSRAAAWKALDASPTPLAYNELYLALQNGTVDAQENNLSNILNSGLYEVQTHLCPSWHLSPSSELTMNRDAFYAMPPDYQELLRTLCRELTAYDAALQEAMEQYYFDCLTQGCGLEVCAPSDDLREQWRERTRAAAEQTVAATENRALYETLLSLLEKESGHH